MNVTQATRHILSGEALPIETPPPDFLGVEEWYMAQPSDWLFQDAQAVYSATYRATLQLPDVQKQAGKPSSDGWVLLRKLARQDAEKRITSLRKRDQLSFEDQCELWESEDLVRSLSQTHDLAHEIAHEMAVEARDAYLLPRLVVDGNGAFIFDLDTDEGRALWGKVPRSARDHILRPTYSIVMGYTRAAKNSDGDQAPADE